MKSFLLPALTFVLITTTFMGCSDSGGSAKEKMYDLHGKVVAVDTEKQEVTIDHDAVPGLMGAMKMPFKVENAKVLEGIKAGEKTITELMKH
jgi:protein SCO1/2